MGKDEAADGGVLLIDEVGDLPHDAQLRLLRVLQSQELSRLGENKIRTVRVKVIAATLHDLDEEVKNKRFREDLLHRLRVGSSIRLPSLRLRDRVFDDVVPELLLRAGHQGNPLISRSALDAISRYSWPGNLRELTSALELAVAPRPETKARSSSAGSVSFRRASGVMDGLVPARCRLIRAASLESMLIGALPGAEALHRIIWFAPRSSEMTPRRSCQH